MQPNLTGKALVADEPHLAMIKRFKRRVQQYHRERWNGNLLERINAIRSEAGTVVLVSHSLREITTSCTRALWLEDGQLRFDGHPEEAVSAYEAHA